MYEVDAQTIVVSEGDVDIGGNPSAEEQAEALENGAEQKINVVHTFNLQATQFDKKSYLVHLKVSSAALASYCCWREEWGGGERRGTHAVLPRRGASEGLHLELPSVRREASHLRKSSRRRIMGFHAGLGSYLGAVCSVRLIGGGKVDRRCLALSSPNLCHARAMQHAHLFSCSASQSFMKATKARIAETDGEEKAAEFEKKAGAYAKKIVGNFKGE